MIYHVTTDSDWEAALIQGFYTHPSLSKEGFIHNCSLEQLPGVIERYYADIKNLTLLQIDESKLTAPLRYELAPSVNEEFPHIFGPINLDAVVKTEPL
jgi:uncharacterized protein (DUF952 family)